MGIRLDESIERQTRSQRCNCSAEENDHLYKRINSLDVYHRVIKNVLRESASVARFQSKESDSMERHMRFTVEKNRVLVPVGTPCLFGCRYCYTRGKDIEPSRLSVEDILA